LNTDFDKDIQSRPGAYIIIGGDACIYLVRQIDVVFILFELTMSFILFSSF